MEQTTLKYLRILIPGLIFYLGFYPIFKYYFGDVYDIKSLDFSFVTVISILIGGIYYQLNFQYLITSFSLKKINNNIFDHLVRAYGKDINQYQKNELKQRHMTVFYRIIDNDESLKKKANNVYFNGIFWTSSADFFLFGLVFWVIYRFIFSDVDDSRLFSDLFLSLAVLSIFLHVISVRKHITLSNDQLRFIDVHKKKEVTEYFDNILQQLPKHSIEEGSEGNKPSKKRILKR